MAAIGNISTYDGLYAYFNEEGNQEEASQQLDLCDLPKIRTLCNETQTRGRKAIQFSSADSTEVKTLKAITKLVVTIAVEKLFNEALGDETFPGIDLVNPNADSLVKAANKLPPMQKVELIRMPLFDKVYRVTGHLSSESIKKIVDVVMSETFSSLTLEPLICSQAMHDALNGFVAEFRDQPFCRNEKIASTDDAENIASIKRIMEAYAPRKSVSELQQLKKSTKKGNKFVSLLIGRLLIEKSQSEVEHIRTMVVDLLDQDFNSWTKISLVIKSLASNEDQQGLYKHVFNMQLEAKQIDRCEMILKTFPGECEALKKELQLNSYSCSLQ